MNRWRYEAGQTIHGLSLVEPLGRGGSSEVWRAETPSGNSLALKILTSRELCKILRFVREVETMGAIDARIALPVGDVVLPGCGSPPACFTMPLAVPIKEHIRRSRARIADRVDIMRRVANCLAKLHERAIFHCDVKPGNIFLYRDLWVFGDFGLALRPGLRPLMAPDELAGTRYYIAPELQEPVDPDRHDLAKCDVYSLAKTAWVTLLGRKRPRSGPHDPADPAQSLFVLSKEQPGSAALDDLLFTATSPNPNRRPTAAGLARALDRWLDDYADRPASGTDIDMRQARDNAASRPTLALPKDGSEIVPLG